MVRPKLDESQEQVAQRRFRLVRVQPDHIFYMFRQVPQEYINVPVAKIPDDAVVCGITFDVQFDSFIVRLASMEYDHIPNGDQIPFEDDITVARQQCYTRNDVVGTDQKIRELLKDLVHALHDCPDPSVWKNLLPQDFEHIDEIKAKLKKLGVNV